MTPTVVVLLATYNGRQWIEEQLDSILNQKALAVRVVISDDGSTDGTLEYLLERAASDPRISFLPAREPTGSSAQNFLRLVRDVETREGEWIAFADQDDVWEPGHLRRAVKRLKGKGTAFSSSVLAFFPSGKEVLLKKDYPQRRYDYIFESPGPGCSFLFGHDTLESVRAVINHPDFPTADVAFHDCLIYAVVRGSGARWIIDGKSMIRYRQHESNDVGANVGVDAKRKRLELLQSGMYRRHFIHMTQAALMVCPPEARPALEELKSNLERRSMRSRLYLLRHCLSFRRKRRDGLALGVAQFLGQW